MWKIFRKKTQEEKELEELSQKIKSEPLNMSTLFSNLNMRGEIGTLYSDLCRRVHPDRFVGDDEMIARGISRVKRKSLAKSQHSMSKIAVKKYSDCIARV